MRNETKREPLIHITRRGMLPWYRAWAIRGGAIALALLVCALITTLVTHQDPLAVFASIFEASFSTQRRTWILFQNIAMLLSVSLAVIPAFRMRFWNLGAEGQMLVGGLATAACMICLRDIFPNWLVIVCMVITSIAAGAVWGVIPALFKAKWDTNETLFTLMMNYVAIQLVSFFIIVWEVPKGAGKIGIINQSTEIGWLPTIGGQKYLLNIIIVAVLTVIMYIYLRYAKHGYEISVVGESERTARYVGIQVDKAFFRRALRPDRPFAGRRHGPHPDHDDHWRQGLHGGHGRLAGQVQPHLDDRHLLPAGVPGARSGPDLDQLRPEPVLLGHPDGHHPLLYHRLRILHQLQDRLPPSRQEWGKSACLIFYPFCRAR